jgi:hypothetical protein
MPRAPVSAIRLSESDRQALEAVAHYLRRKGTLGLFNNNGEINVSAVVRFAVGEIYKEVLKEQEEEAAKSKSSDE